MTNPEIFKILIFFWFYSRHAILYAVILGAIPIYSCYGYYVQSDASRSTPSWRRPCSASISKNCCRSTSPRSQKWRHTLLEYWKTQVCSELISIDHYKLLLVHLFIVVYFIILHLREYSSWLLLKKFSK